MPGSEIYRKILQICRRDPRYKVQAYQFILESLDFTMRKLNRHGLAGREKHITGRELLEGLREYALQQYGLMTRTVFSSWGISSTEDFGNVVFNLVEDELLNKTEDDSPEEFKDVYDFEEVFERNYRIPISWDAIDEP